MTKQELTKEIENHPLFARLNKVAKKYEKTMTEQEYQNTRDFIITSVINEIAIEKTIKEF